MPRHRSIGGPSKRATVLITVRKRGDLWAIEPYRQYYTNKSAAVKRATAKARAAKGIGIVRVYTADGERYEEVHVRPYPSS